MADTLNEVSDTLQKVAPPVILAVGTVGNILTFSVLTRPRARKYSTAIYLIALSIVDFIALYSGLLRILVLGYFETDLRNLSDASCKVHIFVVYFSTHCSSWLVCAVTLERVLSVWFPHRVKTGCHPKSALISVLIIVTIFIIINSHMVVGFKLTNAYNNTTYCYPQGENYGHFIDNAWSWIDMALLFLIPFVIIVLGNVLIIIRVKLSQRLRRRSCPNSSRRRSSEEHVFFLTAMLITLNVVFLICVSPIVIYIIGQYTWWPSPDYSAMTELELATNNLLWIIVNLLNYVNYAINFLLYIFCGSKFREELVHLICGFRAGRQIDNDAVRRDRISSLSMASSVQLSDIIQNKNSVDNKLYA